MPEDIYEKMGDWSIEDAAAAQSEWDKPPKPRSDRGSRGPLYQWIGMQELQQIENAYHDGTKAAVLEAIYTCSLNSLPIPEWCEIAYLKCFRAVRQYRAKSWDDVFGKPHPTGAHLAAKQEKREKQYLVYKRVKELSESKPLGGELFEAVGREFAIGGKTKVSEYYYEIENSIKDR